MVKVVEIADDTRAVIGSITFVESPDRISARRTAAGFELEIPMTVSLALNSTSAPQPLVTDLSATITATNDQRHALFLGRARHYGWFTGLMPTSNISTGETEEPPQGEAAFRLFPKM